MPLEVTRHYNTGITMTVLDLNYTVVEEIVKINSLELRKESEKNTF